MRDAFAEQLTTIVGPANVLTDADTVASFETDWTRRYNGRARLVVRPGDTSEVARLLEVCAREGVPVVPQGGNTGLVGGGVPRSGEVVLSLQRMRALEPVDTAAGEVTVGAGITLAELQQRARAANLDFGVDIASRGSATIGGMIATNAGGVRVLRYGAMRSQIIGLEAVLADGSIVSRLPGLTKDNTGYDLPALFAGSEGTLAIVTRARLRLVPILPHRATALLGLESVEAALAIVGRVRAVPSLAAVEVFFAEGIELVCRHAKLPLPFQRAYPMYLLVECAAARDPLQDLAGALEASAFEDSAIATDRPGSEALWAYRERHTEAINAEGVPHKLDVALPLARLGEFAAGVRTRLTAAVPEARVVLFGHMADGNLHVNVLGLALDDDRATDAVLRYVAELGGSISAEHGIGLAKTRWLHLTRSEQDIAAMRAVKHALDPRNILNPGVIFGHAASPSGSGTLRE